MRFLFVLLTVAAPALAADLFEFRSGFWINLHHYAYSVAKENGSQLAALEPAAWRACVEYYRDNLVKKDLLFDDSMTKLKGALSRDDLSALAPQHASVLKAAAPAYREKFWPQHERDNQAFIAQIEPLLRKHGATLARKLTAFYGTRWPENPVRVDLVPYATFAGAYTTGEADSAADPIHITVESKSYLGDPALEILFHEASHGLFRVVFGMLNDEVRKQGAFLPRRDLWHAVLFLTAGEFVRRELNNGYTPIVYKGLWERGWPMYREPLERLWIPAIDGKVERAAALEALVKEVKVERPAGKK